MDSRITETTTTTYMIGGSPFYSLYDAEKYLMAEDCYASITNNSNSSMLTCLHDNPQHFFDCLQLYVRKLSTLINLP